MAKTPAKTSDTPPQSPDNAGTGVTSGTSLSGAQGSASGSGSLTSSSTITDQIEGDVETVAADAGAFVGGAAKTLGATLAPSASIASIATPEAAMTALKGKVSMLHKIVHDAGHVGSLAITEAEHIVNDMKFLFSYIHTKL